MKGGSCGQFGQRVEVEKRQIDERWELWAVWSESGGREETERRKVGVLSVRGDRGDVQRLRDSKK